MRFCDIYYLNPYAASDWQFVQFAQYLFDQEKKPDTVQNYISSIRILHRLADIQCPSSDQIHFKMLMDSFKRQCDKPVRQAEAIDHNTLKILFTQVNLNEELEAVAWTSVLIGFNLVLRVSNLGPVARNKFDATKNLLRSDYMIRKGFPSLAIRWAKNNQYKNRVNWCPLMPSVHRQICPCWWVNRMIKNIPATPEEPFFTVREGELHFPLTSGQIWRLLRKWCLGAALDPKRFTPHCLRRGGLTWAHNARVTGESLKVLGDCASQEYHKYLEIGFDTRVQAAKQMKSYADKL